MSTMRLPISDNRCYTLIDIGMKRTLLVFLSIVVSAIAFSQNDSIGFYMVTDGHAKRIQPLNCTKIKTKTLGAALTGGIANSNIKSVFNGSSSNNKANSSTKFLLYFPSPFPVEYAQRYYMFASSYTPEDFMLARMSTKKNTRELSVGKVNIFSGSSIGVSEDVSVEVLIKELRKGIYELTFSELPEPGEYCFVFTGLHGTSGYLPVFDFVVK